MNNLKRKLIIGLIVATVVCSCIIPVSAGLGDNLLTLSASSSDDEGDESGESSTYSKKYLVFDSEGNVQAFEITYDESNPQAFKNSLKPFFSTLKDSPMMMTSEFDSTDWTDDMFTHAVSTICNNTNWTPDERLEMECYVMGWWDGLEEGREYIDARERLEMEQYMEAEQQAIEEGREFDPESVVYDYSSLGAIPDICQDDDGNYDPTVCNAEFDAYMNMYFAHYNCTGDYGRENPEPF